MEGLRGLKIYQNTSPEHVLRRIYRIMLLIRCCNESGRSKSLHRAPFQLVIVGLSFDGSIDHLPKIRGGLSTETGRD